MGSPKSSSEYDLSGFYDAVARTQEQLAAFFASHGNHERARVPLERAANARQRSGRKANRLHPEHDGRRAAGRDDLDDPRLPAKP
jgi:hypothetical protein